MNTANLQLAGVLLVLDELLSTLRARGVVSRQEVDDRQRVAALSAANAEAVAFPIRFLQAAGKAGPPKTYSSIAAAVGRAGGDDQT